VDSVSSGLRSDIEHNVTNSAGGPEEDLVLVYYSKRKCVYEAVAVKRTMKRELTANSWDPHAVAVESDSVNSSAKKIATLWKSWISKA
jgi:hypothetical protein